MSTWQGDCIGPYFPFLLGNGVDCVLIDYSGSMSCDSGHLHQEQHQGSVCAWYKATHRGYRRTLLPLIQASYSLIAGNGEAYEIGQFRQTFDPKRALLSTHAIATDFEIRVDSFLSASHVLVERYTLERLPQGEPKICLNVVPMGGVSYEFSSNPSEGEIVFSYKARDDIEGTGIMWIDSRMVGQRLFKGGPSFVLSNVHAGTSFTRYLLLLDKGDLLEHGQDATEIARKLRALGYEEIARLHEEEWQNYQERSDVELPDEFLEYLWKLSLYLLRAHQNPKRGLISIGNYPILWGGGVSNAWDLLFVHSALLSANRVEEAEMLVTGYREILPIAREYARGIGHNGAYYPWFMNYEGRSLDFAHPKERLEIEKFNNGCLVMQVWNQYLYTGDTRVLSDNWNIIQDTVDFLLSSLVVEDGDAAWIKKGEGMDESVERENDTAHLLTTIKAVEALIAAGTIIGRMLSNRYQRILHRLKNGLKRNYRDGILMPYHQADRINTSLFDFYLFNLPDGIPGEGIRKALEECQGIYGLTNPGPYQNLIWPWAENKAAFVLSFLKDEAAFDHILRGSKFTSSLGAFPEKIRPDGFPINYWYVTCHGSYIMAINSMLAHTKGKRLRLLPAVPRLWMDVAFRNLRVPPGLCVSLRVEGGRLQFLEVKNETSNSLEIEIEAPGRYGLPLTCATVKANEGFIL